MMLSARLLLVGLLALVAAKIPHEDASKEGSSQSDELDKLKRENAKLKEEKEALIGEVEKLKSEAGSDSGSGTCVLPDEMQHCTVHGVPYLCGRILGAWVQNHFMLAFARDELKPKIQAAWEATKKAGAASIKYRDIAFEKSFDGVAHIVEKIAGAKKFNVKEYTEEGQKLMDEKMKLVKEPMNKIFSATGASDKLSVSNAKHVVGKVIDFVFNKFAADMEFAVMGKKVKFGHGIIDIVLVLMQAAVVIYGGIMVGLVVFKWSMALGWTGFKINFWIFMTLLKKCVCPAVMVCLLFVYGFVGVTVMHIVADKKGAMKVGPFSLDQTRDRLLLGWGAGGAMWLLLVLIICKCCCKKRAAKTPTKATPNGSAAKAGAAKANAKANAKADAKPKAKSATRR